MRRWLLLVTIGISGCAGMYLPPPAQTTFFSKEPFRSLPDFGPRLRATVDLHCNLGTLAVDDSTSGEYVITGCGQRAVYTCELIAAGREQCARIE